MKTLPGGDGVEDDGDDYKGGRIVYNHDGGDVGDNGDDGVDNGDE